MMQEIFWVLIGLMVVAAIFYLALVVRIANGFAAKILCSGIFVAKRTPFSIIEQELSLFRFQWVRVSEEEQRVTVSLLGLLPRTAVFREGLGSTLRSGVDEVELRQQVDLPQLAARKAFPAVIGLPDAGNPRNLPEVADYLDRLRPVLDRAMSESVPGIRQQTRALIVLHKGRVVGERYAPGFSADTPLAGWSLTKSVVNALTGILVGQGKLDIHQPGLVPEWDRPADPRRDITVDHLLRMSSSLAFDEKYVGYHKAVRMLFLEKNAGQFVTQSPLRAKPGVIWNYASGSTNVICRIHRTLFDKHLDYLAFPYEHLFQKLGMESAQMEVDPSGTYIGSSFMYATARDWAKFGLLYLQDGVWAGERLLPEGWVDYSRSRTPSAPSGQYGAHFWVNALEPVPGEQRFFPTVPDDLFYASGFEEQKIAIIPSKQLVVVRLGLTYPPKKWNLGKLLADIIGALEH